MWILVTSVAAPVTGLMFWKFKKGGTLSVVGMFGFIANFFSMLYLLGSVLYNYDSQDVLAQSFISVQAAKLFVIITAAITFVCGKSKSFFKL